MTRTPYYERDGIVLYVGDCLEVAPELDAESVSAVVTDPPYGLGFMGKAWDKSVPGVPFWTAFMHAMKPGAHLLAFGGSRTYHRMGVAIEDAGLELRDTLMWLYGSGFPKSHDVSKAIDKIKDRTKLAALSGEIRRARAESGLSLARIGEAMQAATEGRYGKWYHRGGHMFFETGMSLPSRPEWERLRRVLPIQDEFADVYDEAEREVLQERTMIQGGGNALEMRMGERREVDASITAPATPEAARWAGWGTALKPSHEPVICARKPLTHVPIEPIVLEEVTHLLGGLICQSVLFASNAEPSSPSSQSVSDEASVSALLLAAVLHGELSAEPSAPMGTFRSPEMASTCLSIAASWNSILGALSTSGSTFTTSTATSLTTALKTLSSLLSAIMPESIIRAVSRPAGSLSSASIAEGDSSDGGEKWTRILSAIARELATWQHDSALTDARNAASISLATIQSVDSVLKRVLTELRTVSDSASHLTPNHEPIILARKPFKGTVAANVLAHGTGALNIDASRIGTTEYTQEQWTQKGASRTTGTTYGAHKPSDTPVPAGRWPANVILDEESAMLLDAQSGERPTGALKPYRQANRDSYSGSMPEMRHVEHGASTGGASRFFKVVPQDDLPINQPGASRMAYHAKASRKERNAGLDGMPERMVHRAGHGNNEPDHGTQKFVTHMQNHHPTVKPLALMRYLVTLITPPGGIVLDPFAGSGSTLVACAELGFPAIGIELSEEYCEIIARRVDHALNERPAVMQPSLLEMVAD